MPAQGRRTAPADTASPHTRAKPAAPVTKPTLVLDEDSNTVSFSMADRRGMPLMDFIKWVQEVSGKRFTYNAQELSAGSSAGAGVNFIGTVRIKQNRFQKDFYSFFQTMLYIKGFAIIPRGEGDLELLEIVMMTGTRGREVSNSARYVAIENLDDYRHQAGVPILTTVPLKHINAQLANNALRPFFASTGGTNAGGSVQIGNVGNKSSLLLQGFGPQVYAAAQLLQIVDAPARPSKKQQIKEQQQGQAKPVVEVASQVDARIDRILKLLKNDQNLQQNPAKQPVDRSSQETDSVSFSMTERDGMELIEFIEWAQQITDKRFTFNVQELTSGGSSGSKINFLGTFEFARDRFQEDFYAFFQRMLYIKGFAVVPRGEGDLELLEIVMMRGVRGREVTNAARYVATDKIEAYRYQSGVPILTTVQLHNINAQHANNALRPFFAATGAMHPGGTVQIGNVGNQSALLLQGFGPQVYAAVKLLQLVDGPAEEPKLVVQVSVLEHQAPEDMQPILTEVLESRSQIRQQVITENGSPPDSGGAASSGRRGLKIVVHDSQNALVLSGSQEQVREALILIARLDVSGLPVDAKANVIYLGNSLAEEMEETLKQFMTENTSQTKAEATTSGRAKEAGAPRSRKSVIF
ncbi:MAG: type II secretory pathway component GspD/PulD (secretin) [Hyphomicrobiaceae bacterium]|jgi:type II secretory pathway component GspD/PulD (secretin)